MKKRNVKLLVSGLTLGLAALTTVGSTYAWFTTSGTATISGMDIKAEAAGDGIFVSTDGITYGNGTIDLKKNNVELKPVTTIDGANFYELSNNKFQRVDDNDYFEYTSVSSNSLNKYVLGFDLYFAVSSGKSITINTKFTGPSNSNDDILYTARYSYALYERENGDTDTALKTTPETAKIFAAKDHNGLTNDYALNTINKLYNKSVTNKAYGIGSNTTQVDNSVFDSPKLISSAAENQEILANAANTYAKFTDNDGSITEIKDLVAEGTDVTFKFVKVHFNLWLEGNDKFCSNQISNETLGIEMTFGTN